MTRAYTPLAHRRLLREAHVKALDAGEITAILLMIGILLVAARTLGELARRVHQPAIIGEILAGIILGPTILGRFLPDAHVWLFPTEGNVAVVLDGLITLSIVLFLLVAGMEVDLSLVWRQGKAALVIGLMGIIAPFTIGFAVAWLGPELLGGAGDTSLGIFALFFATALSISSVPVIAKTLMDMDLYRSELGMIVIAAAVFNDVIGWILFAMILGMLGEGATHGLGIAHIIWITLGFAAFVLTIGRWLVSRTLPWLQAHTIWPGGVITFALVLALFGAAFTEWVGVHAIFGSFLIGVAVGDSPHLREQTRVIIHQFVSFIFAPLFFASIGLHIDFFGNFDVLLVVIVLLVATAGKFSGCLVGAKLSSIPKRQGWAIAFGMNARGAMEIILGLLAYRFGVIGEPMLVALVIMALATSIASGPGMAWMLRSSRAKGFLAHLPSKAFVPDIASRDRFGAIAELVRAAVQGSDKAPLIDEILATVMAREEAMATGVGGGLAIPHARVRGFHGPMIAAGISREGLDFDAPDGRPARLIFLLLTPEEDYTTQLELLADIARTFHDDQLRDSAMAARSYTEFLAALKTSRAVEAAAPPVPPPPTG